VPRSALALLILAAIFSGNQTVAAERRKNTPQRDASPLQQEQKPELPSQDTSQTAAHDAAPVSDSKLVLPDGTSVRLRFVRTVVSSQVIAGEAVNLQVVQEVRVGDLVAIPEHGPAKATVILAQAKRAMGRGGNLEMKIDTVRLANGESASLRTIKDVKGGEHKGEVVGGMVVAGLLFLPAAPFALFLEGQNAVVPQGTEITVYVNGDISLDPARFPAVGTGPQAPRGQAVQQERSEPK
jgi:hypothetical protein